MSEKPRDANPADAGDITGACWIQDPQSGQPQCHFISQTECTQRNGVFTGGLCPAFGSEEETRIRASIVNSNRFKTDRSEKK